MTYKVDWALKANYLLTLPWDIRSAFPGESQLRQSHATKPTVHAGCFSVSRIHRSLTQTTGSLSCTQMLTHATAHGGVRTPSESLHWSWLWEKKPLPHLGVEPASAACRFDPLPTELHPRPIDSKSHNTRMCWMKLMSFVDVISTLNLKTKMFTRVMWPQLLQHKMVKWSAHKSRSQ